jgi:hypothetical protein
MSNDNSGKLPKTLVSGTKRKSERNVNDLRTFEEPPEVKVFKATPDWLKKINLDEFLRPEQPTIYIEPSFNNRTKRK